MARQNSSSGASTAVSSRAVEPPALLCRMSSRPKCPTAARIARSRLSGSVTSVGIAIAPWPARWAVSSPEAASSSAIATFAPSPANRTAVARPIPLPAPVMKAILSARRGIAGLLLMRIEGQAGGLEPGLQDRPGLALGNEQGAAVGPAIGRVRRRVAGAGRDLVERPAEAAEQPHRSKADMAHRKVALAVHRYAIGPSAPRQLDEDADPSERAVGIERHPPHRVAACHREIEDVLVGGQHQPVRARHVVEQQVERAPLTIPGGAQPKQSPGRVAQIGLALVGEIEIAVLRENQVVQPFETLAPRPVEKGFDLAARRIEQHQPLLVVGDEDAAVLVDLEPVRLAVPFRDDREFAVARHPQYLAVRNIDDIEIAGAVEGGSFEKAVAGNAALLTRVLPGAQRIGEASEDRGLDGGRRGKHGRSPLCYTR